MPHKMPIPRGRYVITTAYIDATHGSNKAKSIPHSGYILFVSR